MYFGRFHLWHAIRKNNNCAQKPIKIQISNAPRALLMRFITPIYYRIPAMNKLAKCENKQTNLENGTARTRCSRSTMARSHGDFHVRHSTDVAHGETPSTWRWRHPNNGPMMLRMHCVTLPEYALTWCVHDDRKIILVSMVCVRFWPASVLTPALMGLRHMFFFLEQEFRIENLWFAEFYRCYWYYDRLR